MGWSVGPFEKWIRGGDGRKTEAPSRLSRAASERFLRAAIRFPSEHPYAGIAVIQRLILLAEDNEDISAVYRAILEHRGHAVVCACNGAEAVKLAQRHNPEVIVMDLAMPVMDGFEATRRIREVLDVPILALTAHDLAEREWQAAGFDGYLRKPVDVRVLADAVLDLLREDGSGGQGPVADSPLAG